MEKWRTAHIQIEFHAARLFDVSSLGNLSQDGHLRVEKALCQRYPSAILESLDAVRKPQKPLPLSLLVTTITDGVCGGLL